MDAKLHELAVIWSEGTRLTADELANEFCDYEVVELEEGRDPLDFESWCQTVMGIPNI